MGEILRHADRYSQAFSLELYNKWQSGKTLTKEEQEKVEKGTPWYNNTMRMAKKTVLKSLLTSGFAPLSNEVKSLLDAEPMSGEAVIPDFGIDMSPTDTIDSTGEVVDTEKAADSENSTQETQNTEPPAEPQEKPKRGRPSKNAAQESAKSDDSDSEAVESFFAGVGAV